MILNELRHSFAEVDYYVPEAAKGFIQNFKENANVGVEVDMAIADAEWLKESDKENFDFDGVAFSGWKLGDVYLLSTPGHSPDSVSLYLKEERALFPGDLLWYVNPNVSEGSIDSLLQSIAQLKRLVAMEGIEYLGLPHFLPIEGRERILDHVSEYEAKERALVSRLEDVVAGSDTVSVDECLEKLRESTHPAIKEAVEINYPYFPSYLHRFINVFLRERGWHEVTTGTWNRSASS
jgi:glyoxylase-like metal-dependent hydrolase (beta-lactamase superfamily II)